MCAQGLRELRFLTGLTYLDLRGSVGVDANACLRAVQVAQLNRASLAVLAVNGNPANCCLQHLPLVGTLASLLGRSSMAVSLEQVNACLSQECRNMQVLHVGWEDEELDNLYLQVKSF